jgi:5'-3' exonuclease
MEKQKSLFVIDASNVALHELGISKQCRDREKAPASEWFADRVACIQQRYRPDELVIAFDGDNLYRKELAPDYLPGSIPKYNRALPKILDEVRDWATLAGVPCLVDSAFEAGDIAATLISKHEGTAVFCTSSKMARQLVESNRVALLTHYNPDPKLYRCPRFYLWPDLVADVFTLRRNPLHFDLDDYLCLVGRPGCIGALGIGPVFARALLHKYKTLDAIRDAWPDLEADGLKVCKAQQEGLRSMFDRLALIRNMVLLRRDVPLPKVDLTCPDLKKFSAFCQWNPNSRETDD